MIQFHSALLVQNTQQFWNATTVTSINSTTASLNDITFPSVYICNVNQVTKSFLTRLGIVDQSDAKLLFEYFLEKGPTNLDEITKEANNRTLETIMERMADIYGWTRQKRFYNISSHNCTDMILNLNWKTNPNYTKNFYPAFKTSTDYGACCIIEPFLTFENEKTRDLNPDDWKNSAWANIPRVSPARLLLKDIL